MVQFTSAGINHVVKHPLFTDTDVPLCTVSGIHGPPISEWVVMSILVEGHRLRLVEGLQRERKWGDLIGTEQGSMRDCVGKRCGILGYGSIGRQSRFLFPFSSACTVYLASKTGRLFFTVLAFLFMSHLRIVARERWIRGGQTSRNEFQHKTPSLC